LVSRQHGISSAESRNILDQPFSERRFPATVRPYDSKGMSLMIQQMAGTTKIPKVYRRRQSVPQPERIPVDLAVDETLDMLEPHEVFPRSYERRGSTGLLS
jgi:hypothetical protein